MRLFGSIAVGVAALSLTLGLPARATAQDGSTYGARARVAPIPSGTRRLTASESRDLPGSLGDPFRAIDALPGVVPILNGLPYVYVRGAPPSGTLYFFDDIALPTLFHLALGPAVVHPRMVGPIRLHSGVAPARYGRGTGGVIVGEGAGRGSAPAGEVDLRLIDVSGYIEAAALGGSVRAAGRFGYPGLILSAVVPSVTLEYADYQVRAELPVGSDGDEIALVALGSHDVFATGPTRTSNGEGETTTTPGTRTQIDFHRVELRWLRHQRGFDFGFALRVGHDESSLRTGTSPGVAISATNVGARVWGETRKPEYRVRIGADIVGVAGDLAPIRTSMTSTLGGLDALFARASGRSFGGIYGEFTWRPLPGLHLDLGLRGDFWGASGGVESSLDPRVRITWRPRENLALHAALGVTRQPSVFFVPIPGLSDVAIARGLQTSVQSEGGVSWDLGDDWNVELQGFLSHYGGLLFPDLLLPNGMVCAEVGGICQRIPAESKLDGLSYGAEFFVRRAPPHEVSGFLSYTLARAEVSGAQVPFTPSYDVRHVLNAVAQWDFGSGFTAGMRIHLRAGGPRGVPYAVPGTLDISRYEQYLPWFFRGDANVAYAWDAGWARLRVSLEWMNVTLSQEPISLLCNASMPSSLPSDAIGRPVTPCAVERAPAIFFPNLGLRGEFR